MFVFLNSLRAVCHVLFYFVSPVLSAAQKGAGYFWISVKCMNTWIKCCSILLLGVECIFFQWNLIEIELILILSFCLTFSFKHSGLSYNIAFLNLVDFKDLSELCRVELGGVGVEGNITEYVLLFHHSSHLILPNANGKSNTVLALKR